MNRNRIKNELTLPEITSSNLRPSTKINIYWLLGFVEGDGTFGIKNLVPYFQVAQHNKNISVLNLVKDFLVKLAIDSSIPNCVTPLNSISIFTNKKTNVSSLVVSDIDVLYYYILPLFNSVTFFTRCGL